MYSPADKKEKLTPVFTILLLGYFYVNIRLFAECFIQYRHIGRRSFEVLFGDCPILISVFDIATLLVAMIALLSIGLALASKPSSIRGLKYSSVYIIAFFALIGVSLDEDCRLFSHWNLLNAMSFFVVLFFVYLVFSPFIRRTYPREVQKKSNLGRIALVILLLCIAALTVAWFIDPTGVKVFRIRTT